MEEARERFVKYLEETVRAVENGAIDGNNRVQVVVGNEACDLDSAVSALVYAFHLHKTGPPGNLTLPVMNVPASEYCLKTEVQFALQEQGIGQEMLLFADRIDPVQLKQSGRLALVLVDHHLPVGKFAGMADAVIKVIYHHPLSPDADPEYLQKIKDGVHLTGSCATLVAEELLKNPDNGSLNVLTALLLYETIVLDTVNFSEEAQRVTDLDRSVAQKLRDFIPIPVNAEEIFHQLTAARSDMSNMTVEQALRRDLKVVGQGAFKVAVSTIPKLCASLFRSNALLDEVRKFCETAFFSGALVLGVDFGETAQRDVLVFTFDQELAEKVIGALMSESAAVLGLHKDPHFNPRDKRFRYFKQSNKNATRKLILPLLEAALAGYVPEVQPLRSYPPATASSLKGDVYNDLDTSFPLRSAGEEDMLVPEAVLPEHRQVTDIREEGNLAVDAVHPASMNNPSKVGNGLDTVRGHAHAMAEFETGDVVDGLEPVEDPAAASTIQQPDRQAAVEEKQSEDNIDNSEFRRVSYRKLSDTAMDDDYDQLPSESQKQPECSEKADFLAESAPTSPDTIERTGNPLNVSPATKISVDKLPLEGEAMGNDVVDGNLNGVLRYEQVAGREERNTAQEVPPVTVQPNRNSYETLLDSGPGGDQENKPLVRPQESFQTLSVDGAEVAKENRVPDQATKAGVDEVDGLSADLSEKSEMVVTVSYNTFYGSHLRRRSSHDEKRTQWGCARHVEQVDGVLPEGGSSLASLSSCPTVVTRCDESAPEQSGVESKENEMDGPSEQGAESTPDILPSITNAEVSGNCVVATFPSNEDEMNSNAVDNVRVETKKTVDSNEANWRKYRRNSGSAPALVSMTRKLNTTQTDVNDCQRKATYGQNTAANGDQVDGPHGDIPKPPPLQTISSEVTEKPADQPPNAVAETPGTPMPKGSLHFTYEPIGETVLPEAVTSDRKERDIEGNRPHEYSQNALFSPVENAPDLISSVTPQRNMDEEEPAAHSTKSENEEPVSRDQVDGKHEEWRKDVRGVDDITSPEDNVVSPITTVADVHEEEQALPATTSVFSTTAVIHQVEDEERGLMTAEEPMVDSNFVKEAVCSPLSPLTPEDFGLPPSPAKKFESDTMYDPTDSLMDEGHLDGATKTTALERLESAIQSAERIQRASSPMLLRQVPTTDMSSDAVREELFGSRVPNKRRGVDETDSPKRPKKMSNESGYMDSESGSSDSSHDVLIDHTSSPGNVLSGNGAERQEATNRLGRPLFDDLDESTMLENQKIIQVIDGQPEGRSNTIAFFACYLPKRTIENYENHMQNIMRFLAETFSGLAGRPTRLMYFSGAIPAGCHPPSQLTDPPTAISFGVPMCFPLEGSWLVQCCKLLNKEMGNDLKDVVIVHPNFLLKAQLQTFGRTIFSSVNFKRIRYVKNLVELGELFAEEDQVIESLEVPDVIEQYDQQVFSRKQSLNHSGDRRHSAPLCG